jgi:hypothetical protein
MIRTIDAAVGFVKQNEQWAPIASMILMQNIRTTHVWLEYIGTIGKPSGNREYKS